MGYSCFIIIYNYLFHKLSWSKMCIWKQSWRFCCHFVEPSCSCWKCRWEWKNHWKGELVDSSFLFFVLLLIDDHFLTFTIIFIQIVRLQTVSKLYSHLQNIIKFTTISKLIAHNVLRMVLMSLWIITLQCQTLTWPELATLKSTVSRWITEHFSTTVILFLFLPSAPLKTVI